MLSQIRFDAHPYILECQRSPQRQRTVHANFQFLYLRGYEGVYFRDIERLKWFDDFQSLLVIICCHVLTDLGLLVLKSFFGFVNHSLTKCLKLLRIGFFCDGARYVIQVAQGAHEV